MRHVEASQERGKWSRKAIDRLAQGKEKQGMAAAKKAEELDQDVKDLERPKF